MTELIVEAATAPASAASEQPKAAKKARVAPKGAHVAPKKGKSAKKATPAKKAPNFVMVSQNSYSVQILKTTEFSLV